MALAVEVLTTMAKTTSMVEAIVARVGPPGEWGLRHTLFGGQDQLEEENGQSHWQV